MTATTATTPVSSNTFWEMKVHISPYNPEWPKMFEAEKQKLKEVLGECCLSVEHFGSTSVPGMSAKPIIDITVEVPARAMPPSAELLERITALGYAYREQPGTDPTYYMRFDKGVPVVTHCLHLNAVDETAPRQPINSLIMRDYLRSHPDEVKLYSSTKESIVREGEKEKEKEGEEGGFTMRDYRQRKTAIVDDIFARAQKWYEQQQQQQQ